jgi:hypothetical protein
MNPSWKTNAAIYGLTVLGPNGVGSSGKDISHYDVSFNGLGVAPSAAMNVGYAFSWLGSQVEIDKDITNLLFLRSSAVQLLFQSASIDNLRLDGVVLPGALNGTPGNTVCVNSVLNPAAFIGPTQFGHGNSISLDGCTVPVSGSGLTTGPTVISVDAATLSYSSGTFSIAVASDHPVVQWGAIGQKYFFATAGNAQCSTPTSFKITDMNIVSTTLNIVTDLVGALPTPCSGGAAAKYIAYPAATITQKFSGPADLTQFAAP